MKSRLLTLLLAGIFVFSLTACGHDGAPISSVPAPESATTTTETATQGTADCVRLPLGELYPETFADYKASLLKFTDETAIYQMFRDAKESDRFQYVDGAFEMLLSDRFFLLPVLPHGSTLTGTHVTAIGESEFFVALENGENLQLTIAHRKDLPPNNTEGAPLKTFTNNHDITIKHYHHYIEYLDLHSGYYVWTVDDYYGWFNYNSEDFAVYEAFVKELSFEKVSLDA